MPEPTVRDLLLARADDDRTVLLWREGGVIRSLTWRQYVATAAALATSLQARLDPALPPHVGVLLPNGPAFALHLAAAGLGGHVLVGLNSTRRGAALSADVRKADCQLVIDDPTLPPIESVAHVSVLPAPDPEDLFMLIFTSGTSGDPKAVRVTHRKISQPGAHLVRRLGLASDDRHYISVTSDARKRFFSVWPDAAVPLQRRDRRLGSGDHHRSQLRGGSLLRLRFPVRCP